MNNINDSIRIDDLRSPILTDAHRREIEYWEHHPVNLDADEIVHTAQERTGLNKLQDATFRQRLETRIEQIEKRPRIMQLERADLYHEFIRSCRTQLRLYDLLQRHPEIREVPIRKPIFIAGPPRSGTTHLVNLLASDSRLRCVRRWESQEPIPGPGEGIGIEDTDPRYNRCNERWQRIEKFLPYLTAMQPAFDSREIIGDEDLLKPFLVSSADGKGSKTTAANVNDTTTQTDIYEHIELILKTLQWLRGPNRWILRGHFHALYLDTLLAKFPDATVVFTHRDPTAMFRSAVVLFAYTARMYSTSIDTDSLICHYIKAYEKLMRAAIDNRKYVPESQIVDITFDDFMSDKFDAVMRIYSSAGLSLPNIQRTRMRKFLDDNPRHKNGRVAFDLKKDLDVDPDMIRSQFEFYCKKFLVDRKSHCQTGSGH